MTNSRKILGKEDKFKSGMKAKSKPVLPVNPRISEPYVTVKDAVWKNVVLHERILDLFWNKNWKIQEEDSRSKELGSSSQEIRNRNTIVTKSTKAPGVIYSQSSKVIGCFYPEILEKQQALDSKPVVSRVRFVPEQYGYYRKLKFTKEAATNKSHHPEESSGDFSLKTRHTVNPLLC